MNIKVITTSELIHECCQEFRKKNHRIGFVPTMGYLHEGHVSLIRRSKSISGKTVVSIFVNPTQFSPSEDLNTYPRDFNRDERILAELGTDVLFYPDVKEIYGSHFRTFVEVSGLSGKFEGEFRPQHFRGVTTVVAILFNLIRPDVAIFGRKDAQQAAIIKKMAEDLKFKVHIEVAPIIREKDGLAMSSRNIYLSRSERQDALVIFNALKLGESEIINGNYSSASIREKMENMILSVESSSLDYVRVVKAADFEEVENIVSGEEYYLIIACRIGKTRLIDNLLIKV